MLTRYLFPHRFKWAGWVLVVVGGVLGVLEFSDTFHLPRFMDWLPPLLGEYDPISGRALSVSTSLRENTDLYAVLLIIGGLLAACSREKHEDEYISRIRLDSLLWTLYVYYALLALAWVLVSGLGFLSIMIYAMFAPLLLFLVRFQLALFFTSRSLSDEE